MSSAPPPFDVLVIGGGVMGSAAAYACAVRGDRVALLERFAFGHARGSSHGPSRIVRRTYPSPVYTSLMTRSYELWAAAEAACGEPLLRACGGGVDVVSTRAGSMYADLRAACAAEGVPVDELSPDVARARFGLQLRAHEVALWQRDTCVVDASRATAVFQELARARGATLIANADVTELVTPDAGDGPAAFCEVSAVVDGCVQRFSARRIIIAAGAWAAPLIARLVPTAPRLPLVVWQCTTMFFERKADAREDLPPLPVLIEYGDRPLWAPVQNEFSGVAACGGSTAGDSVVDTPSAALPPIYSCPDITSVGGRRAKFAVHSGAIFPSADARDFEPDVAVTVAPVQEWLRARLPAFDADAPRDASTCLYTMTPDEDFIIDKIHPRVTLAAGFSGHGFKFAPVVGELLAALASAADVDAAVAAALGPRIDATAVRSAFSVTRPSLLREVGLRPARTCDAPDCAAVAVASCSRCKVSKYCGRACQERAFLSGHKAWCRHARARVPSGPGGLAITFLGLRAPSARGLLADTDLVASGAASIAARPPGTLYDVDDECISAVAASAAVRAGDDARCAGARERCRALPTEASGSARAAGTSPLSPHEDGGGSSSSSKGAESIARRLLYESSALPLAHPWTDRELGDAFPDVTLHCTRAPAGVTIALGGEFDACFSVAREESEVRAGAPQAFIVAELAGATAAAARWFRARARVAGVSDSIGDGAVGVDDAALDGWRVQRQKAGAAIVLNVQVFDKHQHEAVWRDGPKFAAEAAEQELMASLAAGDNSDDEFEDDDAAK